MHAGNIQLFYGQQGVHSETWPGNVQTKIGHFVKSVQNSAFLTNFDGATRQAQLIGFTPKDYIFFGPKE